MSTGRRSLHDQFPRRYDVPVLLSLALLILPFGLFLPTVTLSKVGGLAGSSYSVVTGILDLAHGGNLFLALVLFTFSFLFPIVKLVLLWVTWFRRMSPESRRETLHRLHVLGKWSMLDVFVVAVFVGILQFGFLASASPQVGIYLFSAAVLLSMIVTIVQSRLARVKEDGPAPMHGPGMASLPAALLSMLLLGAGLVLPLMEAEKWLFWNRDYSVVTATLAMAKEGDYVLALVVAVFVAILPLAMLAGQVMLVVLPASKGRAGGLGLFLRHLSKWTMVDVFALGLLIVLVQIGGIADVSPRLGLACFLGGALLSVLTTWLMKARKDEAILATRTGTHRR